MPGWIKNLRPQKNTVPFVLLLMLHDWYINTYKYLNSTFWVAFTHSPFCLHGFSAHSSKTCTLRAAGESKLLSNLLDWCVRKGLAKKSHVKWQIMEVVAARTPPTLSCLWPSCMHWRQASAGHQKVGGRWWMEGWMDVHTVHQSISQSPKTQCHPWH